MIFHKCSDRVTRVLGTHLACVAAVAGRTIVGSLTVEMLVMSRTKSRSLYYCLAMESGVAADSTDACHGDGTLFNGGGRRIAEPAYLRIRVPVLELANHACICALGCVPFTSRGRDG